MNRRADIHPPLGYPGGPCYVVQRIQDEVSDPKLRDALIHEVEQGDDLSNPEASRVYEIETVPGVGNVRQLVIGPHSQYRMDLRGVNIPAIRSALKMFQKQMNDWKSQHHWQYDKHSELLYHGEAINYTDPRMGLTIVFKMEGRDKFRLITTYWKGDPDPAPVHCITAYSQPAENLSGVKTLVKPNTDSREPDSALPSPPNTRSKPMGKPEFNTPPASEDAPGGKNLHEDRARTLGTPGTDEHPWVDNSTGYHQVRPDITASLERVIDAAMKGHPFPGTQRQRVQRGKALNYYKNRYRMQRGKIKQQARKWYNKRRTDQRLKTDKSRRKKWPESYARKPGGGYRDNKERSQEYRDKTSGVEFKLDPVPFMLRSTGQWGWVLNADPDWGTIGVDLDGLREFPLETFFDEVSFEGDSDVDRLLTYLDNIFDEHDPIVVTAEDMGVMVLKPGDAVTPPDQQFNRGSEPEGTWPDKIPAQGLNNIRDPDDNPGSAQVIPEGHGFVNKEAARISEIQNGCSSGLVSSSHKIRVSLRRVDPKNLMWLFEVAGSKAQPYKVKVKAVPKGNIRDMNKTDILVSCNCPYWRWQGPEFHAKNKGYLLGRPVGMASSPDTKDPNREHGACKHVLAVLKRVSGFVMPERPSTKPKGKVASLRYLADRIAYGKVSFGDPLVDRVADRYLSRVLG